METRVRTPLGLRSQTRRSGGGFGWLPKLDDVTRGRSRPPRGRRNFDIERAETFALGLTIGPLAPKRSPISRSRPQRSASDFARKSCPAPGSKGTGHRNHDLVEALPGGIASQIVRLQITSDKTEPAALIADERIPNPSYVAPKVV